jgi:nucleoside-diphosphate-sugar epimerase
MKKMIVTGGNGYLGAHLCLFLQKSGFQPIALCRNPTEKIREKLARIPIVEGDLNDKNTLEKIQNLDIEAIVHTVSLDHRQSESWPIETVNQTNVLITWELLELAAKMKLKKFIYFSTVQVLGQLPNTIIDESTEAKPLNRYGLTHLLSENLLNFYDQKYDLNCINLRLSNGYGSPVFEENNCWWLVINDLCRMAFEQEKIVLQSDGTPLRDFIHVQDIAQAVSFLLKQEQKLPSLFQLSSGKTYNLLEIAHIIKAIYQKKYQKSIEVYHSKTVISQEVVSPSEKYTIDNSHLKSIGFEAAFDLEKGILDLFDYLETQKNK